MKFNYFSGKFLTNPKKPQQQQQIHNSVQSLGDIENSNISLFYISHKGKSIRNWCNTWNFLFSAQEKIAKGIFFLCELEFPAQDLISDTKIVFKVSHCQAAIISNSTFFTSFISKNLIFLFIRTSNGKQFFTSQSHRDGIKRIL